MGKKLLNWLLNILKAIAGKQPSLPPQKEPDKVTAPPVEAPKVTNPPVSEERYILRVVKTDVKNKYGLYVLKVILARESDLAEVDSVIVTSGQREKQNFRMAADSVARSMEPIPEGYYVLGEFDWANGANNFSGKVHSSALGPFWMSVDPAPGMKTGRSAIGFHVDWNEDGAPGSAGCLVFARDLKDMKRFLGWFRNPRLAPKKLTVNYGFGTVETKYQKPPTSSHPSTSNPSVKPIVEWIPAHTQNFGYRNGAAIKRIVLHYTTSRNIAGSIAWFQDPAARVSAHYIIGLDGRIVQMVKDADKAFHCWGNNTDTIGIEHVAAKGDKLTLAQELATIGLLKFLLNEYHLAPNAITGHRFTQGNIGETDCPGSLWNSELELAGWVKKHFSA